jgi:hypothetical protein
MDSPLAITSKEIHTTPKQKNKNSSLLATDTHCLRLYNQYIEVNLQYICAYMPVYIMRAEGYEANDFWHFNSECMKQNRYVFRAIDINMGS